MCASLIARIVKDEFDLFVFAGKGVVRMNGDGTKSIVVGGGAITQNGCVNGESRSGGKTKGQQSAQEENPQKTPAGRCEHVVILAHRLLIKTSIMRTKRNNGYRASTS